MYGKHLRAYTYHTIEDDNCSTNCCSVNQALEIMQLSDTLQMDPVHFMECMQFKLSIVAYISLEC